MGFSSGFLEGIVILIHRYIVGHTLCWYKKVYLSFSFYILKVELLKFFSLLVILLGDKF